MTEFSTFEDNLIKKYWEEHPGKLFMEVPVGSVQNRKRRIDAVVIPGQENIVCDHSDIEKEITGKTIHVIEAKRKLNRPVVGQIEVGKYLVESDFEPAQIIPVILCGRLHADLEEYCQNQNIKVIKYDIEPSIKKYNKSSADDTDTTGHVTEKNNINIRDIRNPPDSKRLGAFKGGWENAVNGELYQSIKNKKTHANRGNLFGWIYGKASDEFKEKVWEQYIENNIEYFDKEWEITE